MSKPMTSENSFKDAKLAAEAAVARRKGTG